MRLARVSSLLLGALAAAALSVPAGDAQPKPFVSGCTVSDGTGSSVFLELEPKDIRVRQVVAVVAPRGSQAEVAIGCNPPRSGPDVDQALGVPPRKSRGPLRMSVDGGRIERRWSGGDVAVVPVRTGENRVTLRYRDPQYPGEVTHTIVFTAWVYAIELWGQLESPFKRAPEYPRIRPRMLDAQGNLYATLEGRQGGKSLYGLAKYARGGRLAARFETGRDDDTGLSEWVRFDGPLLVTDNGDVYTQAGRDIARYSAAGKFLGSVAGLGGQSPARSLDELNDKIPRPWPQGVAPTTYFHGFLDLRSPAVVGGAAYAASYRTVAPGKPSEVHVVAFTPDGRLISLVKIGESGKQAWLGGPVLGRDGLLYAVIRRADQQIMLTISPKTGGVKETPDPFGIPAGANWMEPLVAIDADGAFYGGTACTRLSRDSWLYTSSGIAHRRIQHFYHGPSAQNPKLRTDLLTGERYDDSETGRKGRTVVLGTCLFDGGSLYALYDDLRVAKFTLQGAGVIARPEPVKALPAAALRLTVVEPDGKGGERRRVADEGVLLDGRPVSFELTLTDAEGRPLPGVDVDLTVNDRLLPTPGALTILQRTTDAQGRVRAGYKPPLLGEDTLGGRPTAINVAARAAPKGLAPAELSVNLTTHTAASGLLVISRTGYELPAAVPVVVPPPGRGGTISGQVVYDIARPTGPDGLRRMESLPVAGATVELYRVGPDGRVSELASEALSDAKGSFALVFPRGSRDEGTPIALAAPLRFDRYEEELVTRLTRFRQTLRTLGASPFGYRTAPLARVLDEQFPRRLAAAATEDAIDRELDALERVALLSAALLVTHRIVEHASTRFAEAAEPPYADLLDLIDPLNSRTWKGAGRASQEAAWKLFEKTPMKRQLVKRALGVLWLRLMSERGAGAAQASYEATVWAPVKDFIYGSLMSGVAVTGWKKGIVELCMGDYRRRAQAGLAEAASAWEQRTIVYGGRVGPAFRSRYADLESRLREVAGRQLDLDLYKADVKLAFDLVGNSVKILATAYASPAAGTTVAEGVEMMDKGFKALNLAFDTVQLARWAGDVDFGYGTAEQFVRAALHLKVYCAGAGC